MALNFQPFHDTEGEALRGRIHSSLESIYDAYARSKQNAEQERDRVAGDMLTYGFDRRQATPENLVAAQAPAQPGEHPVLTKIREFIQNRDQDRAMKRKQAQGEMDLQGAQTEAAKAKAAQDNAFTGMLNGTGNGSSVIDNVINAVRDGHMSPNMADDYLGRNPMAHIAYVNKVSQSGLDLVGLQNKYDKSKATANFEGGQNVQEPTRLVESINTGLPNLTDLADKAGISNNPMWNSISQGFKRAMGAVAPQEYTTQLHELRAQVAQVLQAHGAPAESAVKRSESMLPDNIGKAQLSAVISKDIPELLSARADALAGKPLSKPSAGDGKHDALLNKYGVP